MSAVPEVAQAPSALHVQLPFLSFDLEALVETRVRDCFSEVADIYCGFVTKGPLSSSYQVGGQRAVVLLHDSLNHEATPSPVVEYLIKHELLHLRHAPQALDGVLVRHPECFRQQEKVLAPERLLAWTWIYVNLGTHLRVRPLAERVDVAASWRSAGHLPRLDLRECARQRHRYRRPAKLYV